MRTLIALVTLCATAAPALADGPTYSARGGVTGRRLVSSSAVTLTTDDLVGWEIAADRRLRRVPLPGPLADLELAAGLELAGAEADGTTFDQLDNNISTWHLAAAAHARVPLRSWLHLQGRAALGAGEARARIADARMPSVAIVDERRTWIAATGVGLALMPRLGGQGRGAFWWGVEAEVGYQTASATPVRAYPQDRAAAELTIPAQYALLGDLDLDGYTFRLGVTIGF